MQGAPTGHPVGKMPEEPTGFHRLRQKALGKLHKEVGEGKWERRPRKGSTLFFRPPLPPISGGGLPRRQGGTFLLWNYSPQEKMMIACSYRLSPATITFYQSILSFNDVTGSNMKPRFSPF